MVFNQKCQTDTDVSQGSVLGSRKYRLCQFWWLLTAVQTYSTLTLSECQKYLSYVHIIFATQFISRNWMING